MSMSNNIEYSALKKRAGLHNWGFMPSREDLELDLGYDLDTLETLEEEDIYASDADQEILHQNELGEYYALQDYEE
ncbi:MAG TPA: hypothetical protein V6C99_01835 [Oculatellaceae cyanobacterium]|jgi:hypothetical protein